MDNLVVNLKYLTPTPTIKCNGGIEVCEGGEKVGIGGRGGTGIEEGVRSIDN